MARIFVPQRQVAVTPIDATLGERYDFARHQFCEACTTAIINLSAALDDAPKPLSFTPNQSIGTIPDMRKRESCQLCQLIVEAVQNLCPPYAAGIADDEIIDLGGLGSDKTVFIYTPNFRIAEIQCVRDLVSEDQNTVPDLSDNKDSPAHPRCSCCSHPLRLCYYSTEIRYELVRAWLRECESQHNCGEKADPNEISQSTHPAILIDIESKKLVLQENKTQRYCALSYVYGSSNPFRTIRENFGQLQEPGALEDPAFPLPATIKDAITIVESIGERYLWVDSLCIIQDDNEFLRNAIKSMGEYYKNSILTIAVVSTSAASEHIPGILPGSRKPLPRIEYGGAQVLAIPLDLHLQLQGSKYESRAWTYQERLLSTRTLYLTKNMVYFHCLQHGRSEITDSSSFSRSINPLHETPSRSKVRHEGLDDWQERSEWSAYFELVRKYSQMGLTYSSDELAAFEGVLGRLSSMYDTKFFAGLPTSALLMALHWTPAIQKSKRKKYHEFSLERREGFPSWSWAGRDGPVEWLEAIVMPGWWEWEGRCVPLSLSYTQGTSLHHIEQLHARCQIGSVTTLSVELQTTVIYPEKILDPGAGLPMRLVKIFDNRGRWCGRLCRGSDSAPTVFNDTPLDKLGLALLSTCSARKIHTKFGTGGWYHCFDDTLFTSIQQDGKPARLCNVLLVEYKDDGTAERRALCQIHADVWETLERKEQDLILA